MENEVQENIFGDALEYYSREKKARDLTTALKTTSYVLELATDISQNAVREYREDFRKNVTRLLMYTYLHSGLDEETFKKTNEDYHKEAMETVSEDDKVIDDLFSSINNMDSDEFEINENVFKARKMWTEKKKKQALRSAELIASVAKCDFSMADFTVLPLDRSAEIIENIIHLCILSDMTIFGCVEHYAEFFSELY